MGCWMSILKWRKVAANYDPNTIQMSSSRWTAATGNSPNHQKPQQELAMNNHNPNHNNHNHNNNNKVQSSFLCANENNGGEEEYAGSWVLRCEQQLERLLQQQQEEKQQQPSEEYHDYPFAFDFGEPLSTRLAAAVTTPPPQPPPGTIITTVKRKRIREPHAAAPRAVNFDRAEIHVHAILMGDNPACTSGYPLTMDWYECAPVQVVDIREKKEPTGGSSCSSDNKDDDLQFPKVAADVVTSRISHGELVPMDHLDIIRTTTTTTTTTITSPRMCHHHQNLSEWKTKGALCRIRPAAEREECLRQAGYSTKELRRLNKPVNLARARRQRTVETLHLEPLQLVWQHVCRQLVKAVVLSVSSHHRRERQRLKLWRNASVCPHYWNDKSTASTRSSCSSRSSCCSTATTPTGRRSRRSKNHSHSVLLRNNKWNNNTLARQ